MADTFYTPNNDAQNYPFCRLKLEVKTFGHSNDEPTSQNQNIPIELWGLV